MTRPAFRSRIRWMRDRKSALEFLCRRYKRKGVVSCPRCRSETYWVTARGRLQCARCRSDYTPFLRTGFGSINVNFQTWLILVQFFAMGLSANHAAREAEVSYATALRAFDCIRHYVMRSTSRNDRTLRGEFELDEAYFGGRRKGNRGRSPKNKQIVFGVLERRGRVSVEVVRNVKAKTLLKNAVRKVKRGSIVYTGRWVGYDTLVFAGYKHMKVDHSKVFGRGEVHINGLEGFWSYAKETLAKFHGVSPAKFPLYIKEMEWRYNNRHKDQFVLLVDLMLRTW